MGERLSLIRSEQMRWADWRESHPRTQVMSYKTGYRRPDDRSPYGDYAASRELLFPVSQDGRYHPKTRTIGVRQPGGVARGYQSDEPLRLDVPLVEESTDQSVRLADDAEAKRFHVSSPPVIEVLEAY